MARYLLRSNSPRVLLVRSRSRSPSLETLTPAGRIAGQRLVRRYQAKARRHWKEIFASFVLIACCVMVVTFIIGWNRKLGSGKKPFKGSRQRGTFGLPEPTQAQNPENTEEQDVYKTSTASSAADGRDKAQEGSADSQRCPTDDRG
ncbi:hypothetical protein V5799_015906 [Amblyomma americanum]|uniref:Uncharacterized protein n=1 Tax=Amblyomma americanum TaxID=6943 RepID=A0AAQ4F7C4_AMBAM